MLFTTWTGGNQAKRTKTGYGYDGRQWYRLEKPMGGEMVKKPIRDSQVPGKVVDQYEASPRITEARQWARQGVAQA